jgi:diguanylate cyclase (GGDEF)-like protein
MSAVDYRSTEAGTALGSSTGLPASNDAGIAQELSSERDEPPISGSVNMATPPAFPTKMYVYPAAAATSHPILRATWMQVCIIAAMIAVVWGSISIHLVQVHNDIASHAARDASNLAYAAEQSIGGMIAEIDQTLLFIRAARATDPLSFDIDSWITVAHADQNNFQIGIVDRHGMLQPNKHNAMTVPIDLLGSLHFREQLISADDPLYIAEPLLSRPTGTWSLEFIRKITAADGSFDGTVVLSVNPAWLTRLYDALDEGQGALMVTGVDGVVRARTSSSDLGIGKNIRSSTLRLITAASAATHGNFRSVSPLDGVERFVSFRRMRDYPLIVSVGLNADGAFASYFRERQKYFIVGAILTILVVFVGALLIKQNWRLLHSRQVLSAAVENISQGLMMIDERRQLVLINGRAIELLAIPPELLARAPSFDDLIEWQRDIGEFGTEAETEKRILTRDKSGRVDFSNTRYERTRPNGVELEVRTQMLGTGGAMRTFTDITDRKRAEERSLYLANHDALTDLPNRMLLNDRLSQAMARAARDGGALAVLALDLNRFKAINDAFGHTAGDQILVLVASRLKAALRAADTLARVGGDEFIVLQADVGQPAAAGELAKRLTEVLSEPFELNGHQPVIGTSVGIALYPLDGDSAAVLLRNADTALYRAKTDGRDAFRFFEAQMDAQLHERLTLEEDLRHAVGTDQLRLHYQPTFSAITGLIDSFEALLRWQHPALGNIPPMMFIPIAEDTGMILTIGTWVLEEACRAAAAWADPKGIAVNLSAVQLRNGQLPAQVADILRRSGLSPRRLELEVTETMLIGDPGHALATLHQLRKIGVRIACDDFGTGYSSFSYLRNLAFDRIKIDKSFVQELGVAPSALRIVQTIIAMAKSLDMDVTAEGVETEKQFAMLCEQGCDALQGFLLGRPVPGDEVWRYLRDAATAATARAAAVAVRAQHNPTYEAEQAVVA